jgi:serine protease Do
MPDIIDFNKPINQPAQPTSQRQPNLGNNQFSPRPGFAPVNPSILPTNIMPKPEAAPELKPKKTTTPNFAKNSITLLLALILISLASFASVYFGYSLAKQNFDKQQKQFQIVKEVSDTKVVDEKSAVVDTVKNTKPSVVSIIISKELANPRYRQFSNQANNSTQTQEIGAGSGFIVSEEGYILTNRHVVEDSTADYTVIFDDKTQLKATVLDKDPVFDLAVIKVDAGKKLTKLNFGDSDQIQVGQTAIAIGNSLGEFNNSVSKGIISGLNRTITTTDASGNSSETLEDIIQTDASINPGNSGGPLLDIDGNVLGINVAAAVGSQSIGFAIPINMAKADLESVIQTGKIQRPYLGINYLVITPEFAKYNNLKYDYGILVTSQDKNSAAVEAGSPAALAGLKLNDIILEINGQKLDSSSSFRSTLQKYKVGDSIKIKILRGDSELELTANLAAYPVV